MTITAKPDRRGHCLLDRAAPKAEKAPSKRGIGRPKTGRVVFIDLRLEKIPEKAGYRRMARALGVSLGCVQQWVRERDLPLPVKREDHDKLVICRGDLIRWLIETKRYDPKGAK